MSLIYTLGIRIIYILIAIASIFNSKARFWIKGRKNLFKRLKAEINNNEKLAWFHCASLGEFEQGRPVIEKFKSRFPHYKILLTFYSPSGYEIRKNYEKADYIYYLPIDTPGNAKQFLEITNPNIVFFIKYEFWYHFLKEINQRDIKLYLVSGIFRPEQRFFKKHARKYREMLHFFTHLFVQNQESKELLNSINFNNVTIAGDTRFDRVYEITQNAKKLNLLEKFKQDKLTLIAGSTWKPDEEIIVEYVNQTQYELKLIIAPHEIHKDNINRLQNAFKQELKVLKYSEANEENIANADVLIIDSIGLLSSLYNYGNVAYIGGGFGKGIHNTLEAATFGLPILFGPNYLKFQEAIELVRMGSAFSVSNYDQLKEKLNFLFYATENISKLGKLSADYVKQNYGATQKILSSID